MASRVRVKMNNTQKILLKRYLNKNGNAQKMFTKECVKTFDGYTPYDTGRLKNMMIKIETSRIIYSAPYSRKQYYGNKGLGKHGTQVGGRRGKFWDRRAFADNGDKIVKSIADFVGGRSR